MGVTVYEMRIFRSLMWEFLEIPSNCDPASLTDLKITFEVYRLQSDHAGSMDLPLKIPNLPS